MSVPAIDTGMLDLAEFRGVPWRLGGRDPATGLDCLGFALAALGRLGRPGEDPWRRLARAWLRGVWLPAPPDGWARTVPPVEVGDLLVAPTGSHVAVAEAGGTVVAFGRSTGAVRLPAARWLERAGVEVWRRC